MKLVLVFLFLCNYTSIAKALEYSSYEKKPALVVLLVIDQFRSDYLHKFSSEFIPPGANGEVGGFRYLMQEGAYFPSAEYEVMQCMTCPGHAMIATGSYPTATGISLNDWYDRDLKKNNYCAFDAHYGVSPMSLKTTTFGDELKATYAQSKVFSVALKDRAAIMMGGHRSNLSIWFNNKSLEWETSSYYAKDIPSWLKKWNKDIKTGKKISADPVEFKKQIASPLGSEMTLELAAQLIQSENLGKTKNVTDVLTTSLSSHDFAGHMFGPDSPQMHAMTIAEDKAISKFLTQLKKHLGSLQNVVFVLTADHGVAPNVEPLKAANVEAGKLDIMDIYKTVYSHLDKKFGKPKKEWIIYFNSLNFYFNPEALSDRGITLEDAEREMKISLNDFPGVGYILTGSEIQKGILPLGLLGTQVLHQYNKKTNGDVIVVPKPFYFEKDDVASTHMTGYFYDRSVPLILMGANIKKGVYSTPAKVLDIAPTLAFILKTLAPPTTSGRVLNEIIKN